MAYFGVDVNPSMNPSGVQLRRYAIHGYAHHINPEVLIDPMQRWRSCSINRLKLNTMLALALALALAFDFSRFNST